MNFKLHDSYANNNRVVTKPPYEVTETGWGGGREIDPKHISSRWFSVLSNAFLFMLIIVHLHFYNLFLEFEIQIKIYLADPVERPVIIYHVLKLFQVLPL